MKFYLHVLWVYLLVHMKYLMIWIIISCVNNSSKIGFIAVHFVLQEEGKLNSTVNSPGHG